MPISVAEAKSAKVTTLGDKKFQLPDYLLKPRIVGFLNTNKANAYSRDELYQALVPNISKDQYPAPPKPLTDPLEIQIYELGIDIGRQTFFTVKLQELFDEGEIFAGKKDGEDYYYVE